MKTYMNFRDFLKNNIVFLDGGMGTLLQSSGLKPGEAPERWNLTHERTVTDIHKAYFDAGSNVVCTNTFGANLLRFSKQELDDIICAAVRNAKAARAESGGKNKFIALDIGPCGKLLKPLGDLDFEDAVSLFAHTVRLGVKYGVDLIIIETMNDSYETKAALLAARENSSLPVLVSNVYGEDGKLMTGANADAMVAMLEGMGVDALGANCSLGPRQLAGVARRLLSRASVPVLLKPNAGLPKSVGGKTVFDVMPDEFACELAALIKEGLRIAGGCCGTTPEYIKALTNTAGSLIPLPIENKRLTTVSSYTRAVDFGAVPLLIGERINPTGNKRMKQALHDNDMDYILKEAIAQQEKGVHILDVNVGLPDIDEPSVLENVVCQLQTVTDLPLQIDTSNIVAMERALRRYNGKALINSVNGTEESMRLVFPLVKKYGGVVIALTLDERGIPMTKYKGRFFIGWNIKRTAEEYGIDRKDIIFDTLAMPVSSGNASTALTLQTLRHIKNEFPCHTSLGISNISYGLPARGIINSAFFAMALECGLSAAIINPFSEDIMKTYYAYNALMGMDENCAAYISAAESFAPAAPVSAESAKKPVQDPSSQLQSAIIKGLKDSAALLTNELLKTQPPLDIVKNEIIPALDTVGAGFEKKTVYLPQLLMSAEAAKCAFEQIRSAMPTRSGERGDIFVIATVKGDIHDIGKNIVKLLLENYGFSVIDLGRDVPAETIAEAVVANHASLLGLSALMTTTVPAMEETIKLVREKAPWCKIVVGGAVLTEEYAGRIGADKYAKDAMETVRFTETVIK